MPSVTVDLADLETLVMTTGALKTIEGALQARKADPFVREHLDFTAAHDRLATAMRNAMRASADTLVPFEEPLDDDEIKLLRRVDGGLPCLLPEEKAPEEGQQMSVGDRLACKGCVVFGHFVTGILWSDKKTADLTINPEGFPIKITDRGRQKLAALDAKKPEVVT